MIASAATAYHLTPRNTLRRWHISSALRKRTIVSRLAQLRTHLAKHPVVMITFVVHRVQLGSLLRVQRPVLLLQMALPAHQLVVTLSTLVMALVLHRVVLHGGLLNMVNWSEWRCFWRALLAVSLISCDVARKSWSQSGEERIWISSPFSELEYSLSLVVGVQIGVGIARRLVLGGSWNRLQKQSLHVRH